MDFIITSSDNVITLTPTGLFSQNLQFTFTISPGMSGMLPDGSIGIMECPYEFYFTTKYCPLFTTVTRVKLTGGPTLENVPNDTIYRMIHKNSIDAVDLYNLSQGKNVIGYEQWGCEYTNVPIILRRYVECKTAYDLISLQKLYNTMNPRNGGETKTLGDMTIRYDGNVTSSVLPTDPNKLKELYDCWNSALRSFNTLTSTVKSFYDTTKGYIHPVRDIFHNRVIRPVVPFRGNFTPGTHYWRGI